MQADALKVIESLVNNANPGRRIVTAPAEPPHVYYVEGGAGELVRKVAAAKPCRAHALDLDSLARWAKDGADKDGADEAPTAFYSRTGVVAGPMPCNEQADRIEFKLSPSPQLATLQQWERNGKHTYDQRGFALALRTLFADCWAASPRLLEAVRGVRATVNSETNAAVGHGKQSLGKTMITEMTGVQAVPEEVRLWVPVFAQPTVPVRANVRVAIEPDPQTVTFTLHVVPGDIEAALTEGESYVRDALAGLLPEVPLYRGSPN